MPSTASESTSNNPSEFHRPSFTISSPESSTVLLAGSDTISVPTFDTTTKKSETIEQETKNDPKNESAEEEPLEPIDTVSLRLVYAISSLTTTLSEWISRMCAIAIVIIFISFVPETECNSRISYKEALIRGAIMTVVGGVMDTVGLSYEQKVMECNFIEGASSLAAIQLGWRTYALVATLQLAVVAAMVAMEAGFVGPQNACFKM
jgi:hypothetical protein